MDLKTLLLLGIMTNMTLTDPPVTYTHTSLSIASQLQQIHTLRIDITNPNITLQNMLSYDQLFGFETTSDMAKRVNGWAAVNGTFFGQYGEPMGALIHNGEIYTLPSSTTPVFAITKDREVYIGPLDIKLKVRSGLHIQQLSGLNRNGVKGEIILYTPIYGSTTRVIEPSMNYIMKNNKVVEIQYSNEPVRIPEEGMVITHFTDQTEILLFEQEQSIILELEQYPDIGEIQEAFQSGGWLVQNRDNVARPQEPFMGLTTLHEPRTIIGRTPDNHIIINTIDGRQPGYSTGFTGYQAAEIMIQQGCTEAVYLDGGASTTMIIKNQLVNQPSNNGKERIISHALVVKPYDEYMRE